MVVKLGENNGGKQLNKEMEMHEYSINVDRKATKRLRKLSFERISGLKARVEKAQDCETRGDATR